MDVGLQTKSLYYYYYDYHNFVNSRCDRFRWRSLDDGLSSYYLVKISKLMSFNVFLWTFVSNIVCTCPKTHVSKCQCMYDCMYQSIYIAPYGKISEVLLTWLSD